MVRGRLLSDREITLGFAGFIGATVLEGTQQVFFRAGWTWADTQSGGALNFYGGTSTKARAVQRG